MAGVRGNYNDTSQENVHAADLNTDLATLLAAIEQGILDLMGGANFLLSGGHLSNGSGMATSIDATVAYAAGIRGSLGAGSVTPAVGDATHPRYDVVYVQIDQTATTNPSSGNPAYTDTPSYHLLPGTPAVSPVKPTLSAGNQVQIASIYVPAGATAITQCTLNGQDTSPNSQGPMKSLVDLLVHILANATSSTTVHGIRQGSGNMFDADTVDGQHASQLSTTGAVTAEQTARQNGDASLQAQINNIISGAQQVGSAASATTATSAGTASSAGQLNGQPPAHYATASGNDGIADQAKKVGGGALVDVYYSGTSDALGQSGHVDKTFVFTQPFTRDPTITGTCRSSYSNGLHMEVGRPTDVSPTQCTVRFTNSDGNPQTLSNYTITAVGS